MELLDTFIGKFLSVAAIGLFIMWWMWSAGKEEAIIHGFYDDFNDFMDDIDNTDDERILNAFSYAVGVFRNEYRKVVKKEVVDDACGKLQAAIQNRIKAVQNTIHFLTEA